MQLATVLTPMSDENLRLAAQCGVTSIVCHNPGPTGEDVRRIFDRVAQFDLQLAVIEGYLPIEKIKIGQDTDGEELRQFKSLVQHMGAVGIPTLCYNFMAGTDWVRTRLDSPQRAGARVTEFRLSDVKAAVLLGHDAAERMPAPDEETIRAEQLWENLQRFLEEVLPVAEKAGVVLAMHPDDPPLPSLMGKARIMNSVENFERLVAMAPSSSNAICFCQGTFAEMGVDIPATIRRLGPHIRYVHFRDVEGTAEDFRETFHDNGPTDMAAAMRAYREIGFQGAIRPDHVPQLVGEESGEPGYTMLGRLFAYGFLRGLMQATE